jgi:hypothetical protein
LVYRWRNGRLFVTSQTVHGVSTNDLLELTVTRHQKTFAILSECSLLSLSLVPQSIWLPAQLCCRLSRGSQLVLSRVLCIGPFDRFQFGSPDRRSDDCGSLRRGHLTCAPLSLYRFAAQLPASQCIVNGLPSSLATAIPVILLTLLTPREGHSHIKCARICSLTADYEYCQVCFILLSGFLRHLRTF